MSQLKPIEGEDWEFEREDERINIIIRNVKNARRVDRIMNFFRGSADHFETIKYDDFWCIIVKNINTKGK